MAEADLVTVPGQMAQALARTEVDPAKVGEALTDPELLAVQKLLAEAAREGYPKPLEDAARTGLLALAKSPSRAKADYLHTLLAERAIGTPGANPACRAAAAQALVAMGFPYALEIAPEDLALLKRSSKVRRRVRAWLAAFVGLGASGLLVLEAIEKLAGGGVDLSDAAIWALVAVTGVIGSSFGELLVPEGTDAQKRARVVLLLSLFGAVLSSLAFGAFATLAVFGVLLIEAVSRPLPDKS